MSFFANESKCRWADIWPSPIFFPSFLATLDVHPPPQPFCPAVPRVRTIRLNYRGAHGVKWVSARGQESTRNGGRTAFRGLHSDDGFWYSTLPARNSDRTNRLYSTVINPSPRATRCATDISNFPLGTPEFVLENFYWDFWGTGGELRGETVFLKHFLFLMQSESCLLKREVDCQAWFL